MVGSLHSGVYFLALRRHVRFGHLSTVGTDFRGQLDLGGNLVDVYVLDTGERVISMRGAVKAMTGQDAGNLVEYISIQGLKEFINKDLVLVESKDFFIPGTQFRGRGITAEQFEAILTAYVKALNAGTLTTSRQREIAITCAILSTAFLRVGIIAQIDEATGYQYVRAEDALQLKLRAFIADELRDWGSMENVGTGRASKWKLLE